MVAASTARRGAFISFEGGEGTGKSTQARRLKDALEARGFSVVLTREPGGSPGAEEIRRLLVSGEPERWTALSETLLFLAARADHVARVIQPALAEGRFVLCDRFFDSTLVYQGIARGLGIETVRTLQETAFGDFAPDLTFVLDLDPAQGLARAQERHRAQAENENRFEQFDAAFHARLRDAFRTIATENAARCVLVNAARAPDTVAADIWSAVEARLALT
jgi:dTMP kinase